MKAFARKSSATVVTLAAVALISAAAFALTPKEARDQLDLLAWVDPSLRVVESNVDATGYSGPLPAFQAMEAFRAEHGSAWRFTIDLRRGVTSLLDGGAIPFIPGVANDLSWEDFAPGCASYECLPVATVEALARSFIDANSAALGFQSSELVLDPAGCGPFGGHLYFLRFGYTAGGLPVEVTTAATVPVAVVRTRKARLNECMVLDGVKASGCAFVPSRRAKPCVPVSIGGLVLPETIASNRDGTMA